MTGSELQRLHDAALEVMRDPGARIMTEPARELLVRNGATQEGHDLVRIPGELVGRALQTAPNRFTIFDRAGEPALDLGASKEACSSHPSCS